MFINDIVKIKFVNEGYLPNWPYHLISDEEMMDAFLTYPWYDYRTEDEIKNGVELTDDDKWSRFLRGSEVCYFRDNYPLYPEKLCGTGEGLVDESLYRELVEAIAYHISVAKDTYEDDAVLPDWIYSYMIGSTVGPNTPQLDMHYTLVLLDADNDFDEYTPEAASKCYKVSKRWLSKYANLDHRPPTMFGEPHVIKSLRLQEYELS